MPPGPPPRKQQIVTIVVMLAMLIGLLLLRDKCGSGAANLFRTIDSPAGAAAAAVPAIVQPTP